jgi:hypothetical protein
MRSVSLDKLSQDDWIVAGVAILLVFDLLFLPWFDQTISAGAQSVSITSTATGAPDGWLGVLALLAVVALLADLAIERLSPQTQLPMIGGSRAATRTLLAWTGVGLLAFKLLIHLGSAGGIGFWGALLLGGGLVYMTRRVQELETSRA